MGLQDGKDEEKGVRQMQFVLNSLKEIPKENWMLFDTPECISSDPVLAPFLNI
jgi:hypothetical protein